MTIKRNIETRMGQRINTKYCNLIETYVRITELEEKIKTTRRGGADTKRKSVALEAKWRDVLKQAENIRKDPEDMKPLDNTYLEWTEEQLSVLSKGQKFVLAPERIK